jgi:hypothetical protein
VEIKLLHARTFSWLLRLLSLFLVAFLLAVSIGVCVYQPRVESEYVDVSVARHNTLKKPKSIHLLASPHSSLFLLATHTHTGQRTLSRLVRGYSLRNPTRHIFPSPSLSPRPHLTSSPLLPLLPRLRAIPLTEQKATFPARSFIRNARLPSPHIPCRPVPAVPFHC